MVRGTAGVQVKVREEPAACPVCEGRSWKVQKTAQRCGKTIAHGQFEARETVFECAAGCHHPSGARVVHRSLGKHLVPGRGVGYDILVFVGLQRFIHHRQREEIRTALEREHGIVVSSGSVSELARLFLEYVARLHRDRADRIRAVLQSDGGWPLHVDATGEDGRGTLFVAMAGWRGWVLGSWKLATERSELILPCVRETVVRFGVPCAVMRDLGRAVTLAVNDIVAEFEQDIPVLACHQHLLADVGKDLLEPVHGELRGLFRWVKVRPRLRSLVRDIGRKIGEDIGRVRGEVQAWQETTGHIIEPGITGMATVRALAQWVLDYKAEATGLDFPFDRPYLDLYNRCLTARRATDAYLRCAPNDRKVTRAIERLHGILDPVVSEVPFGRIARGLHKRAALLDELRDTLRLAGKSSHPETEQELSDMHEQLDQLVLSLKQRRPDRGPAPETREAIDLILDHIAKHGRYLWGHEIALPPEAGGGTRLVARTNTLVENFFKAIKHGERRRSGRKILTQDFEHLPAEAALACNLKCPDYVSITCGSLDRLPEVLADLDRADHQRALRGQLPYHEGVDAILRVASASLSTADRRVVRTEAMNRKVLAAARSRAPRRPARRSSALQATGS